MLLTPSVARSFRAIAHSILLAGTTLGVTLVPGAAQAQSEGRSFQITAGPLEDALRQFTRQSGVQVGYDSADVRGRTATAVSGGMSAPEALSKLLTGTGLTFRFTAATSVRLEPAPQSADGAIALGPVRVAGEGSGDDGMPVSLTSDPGATEGTRSYAMKGPSNTATRLNLTTRETPQTISVLTRQQIEDQQLTSVAEMLEQTAGISVQPLGSERFTIYARGYTVENYQYDGIPTTLDIVSQVSPQGLGDAVTYDRIEVLRGAVGLMTGAGDPSATVNLVRKRPTSEFQGHVALSGGSWERLRGEVDISSPLNSAGTIRARAVLAHDQGESFTDYYKHKKQVAYGVIEADVTPSTLVTIGADFQRNDPTAFSATGLPLWNSDGSRTDFARSANSAAKWSYNKQDVLNAFGSIRQELGGDWVMRLAGNYLHTDRNYMAAYASWGFPDKTTGEGVRLYGGSGQTRQRQLGLDLMVQGSFELLGGQHEMVAGLSYSDYRNYHQPNRGTGIEGRYVNVFTWDNYTAEPTSPGTLYDGDTVIKQKAGYATFRFKPLDGLSLLAGARLSNYDYSYDLQYTLPASQGNNRLTTYKESAILTPYAGIVYDVARDHSVYASITSIYRAQSTRDRNGETLKPREGMQYEVGFKSALFDGALNTSIALFAIDQDNFAVVDTGYTVPGTTTAAYQAVQGARTRGFDLEATGEIIPGWNVSTSFSHSVTRRDGARLTTTAPKDMFKLWTSYRFADDRMTVGGGVNWQSAFYLTTTPSTALGQVTARQGSYALVNLMGRYAFTNDLSLSVNVNNLFDKDYLSAIDQTFYGYYRGDPRNFLATLRYNF